MRRSTCSCKEPLLSNTAFLLTVGDCVYTLNYKTSFNKRLIPTTFYSIMYSFTAIRYYRRAIQLVPDIESKIDEFKPRPVERKPRGLRPKKTIKWHNFPFFIFSPVVCRAYWKRKLCRFKVRAYSNDWIQESTTIVNIFPTNVFQLCCRRRRDRYNGSSETLLKAESCTGSTLATRKPYDGLYDEGVIQLPYNKTCALITTRKLVFTER